MTPLDSLIAAATRALPFLRDEAGQYEDDGSNEPLEALRDIESAIAALSPPAVADERPTITAGGAVEVHPAKAIRYAVQQGNLRPKVPPPAGEGPVTGEMVRRFKEAFHERATTDDYDERLRAALSAALAAQPQPVGEVKAWVDLQRGQFGASWHTSDPAGIMPEGRYYFATQEVPK